MPQISHLKITQAGLVAAFTQLVGLAVAFVPSFGPVQQALIAGGTTAIAAAFLIANAIHALIATKVSAADIEGGVRALAKDELGKLNVNGLVQDALNGVDLAGVVQGELNKILSGLATAPTPTPAPAPAPVGEGAPAVAA